MDANTLPTCMSSFIEYSGYSIIGIQCSVCLTYYHYGSLIERGKVQPRDPFKTNSNITVHECTVQCIYGAYNTVSRNVFYKKYKICTIVQDSGKQYTLQYLILGWDEI